MNICRFLSLTILALPASTACSDSKGQKAPLAASSDATGSSSAALTTTQATTLNSEATTSAGNTSTTSTGASTSTSGGTGSTSITGTDTGDDSSSISLSSSGSNETITEGSGSSSMSDDVTGGKDEASGTSGGQGTSGGESDIGTSSSSAASSDATSESQNPAVPDPPPLQNGQDGHATHYWDCCKPSCAWPDQGQAHACTLDNQPQGNPDEQSGCFGGNSYQCWSMAPWAVSDTLAYGFAAFNSGSCGTCYQLEFTGTSSAGYDDPGAASISHKIMIVQTVNRGGIAGGQFDLLVPGGGVGDFDACSRQWNASGSLGERYGGFFLECRKQNADHAAIKQCARSRCEQMFTEANEADLLSGCLFWVDWANVADNPNFKYGQVACPADISAVSGM